MAVAPAEVTAGSKLLLTVDGVDVGFVTDARMGRPNDATQVIVLGSEFPVQIELMGQSCTLSFGTVVPYGRSLEDLGIIPNAVDGALVNYKPRQILLSRIDGTATIGRFEGCKPTTDDNAVGARTLLTANSTWACTRGYLGTAA